MIKGNKNEGWKVCFISEIVSTMKARSILMYIAISHSFMFVFLVIYVGIVFFDGGLGIMGRLVIKYLF